MLTLMLTLRLFSLTTATTANTEQITTQGNWCGAGHGGLGPMNDCGTKYRMCLREPRPYYSYSLDDLKDCTSKWIVALPTDTVSE